MNEFTELFGEPRGGGEDDATRGRSAGTLTNPEHDATRGRSAGTPGNPQHDSTRGRV